MTAPYSLVCGNGHVLNDEIAHEPSLEENGSMRCSESGCLALVYSHCLHCNAPLPGYIDGVRYERHGNFAVPKGRFGSARGLLGEREWREDCPHCKSPYPWAPDSVWVGYHKEYLAHEGTATALPLLTEAEEAHSKAKLRSERQAKTRRRADRRERRQAWAGSLLDTWPKRVTAIAAAIAAVLLLVFGVDSFADLGDDGNGPSVSVPETVNTDD